MSAIGAAAARAKICFKRRKTAAMVGQATCDFPIANFSRDHAGDQVHDGMFFAERSVVALRGRKSMSAQRELDRTGVRNVRAVLDRIPPGVRQFD
jgi:hypothetical protein